MVSCRLRATFVSKYTESNKRVSYDIPTQEEIDFMKERVKGFNVAFKTKGRMASYHKNDPDINILGFRLIEFKQQQNEITI